AWPVALAMLLVPTGAFAQVGNLATSLNNVYGWERVVGGGFCAIGAGGLFIKIAIQHDTRDLGKLWLCLGGGVGLLMVPSILSMMFTAASGTATITSWQ
ncbi:MAG: hypothetical protein KGR26_16400, partial [Cyanobacteria bacterium REEB65]|nr:hypothetical protein [Cyanobacteria bacterium REEB65]